MLAQAYGREAVSRKCVYEWFKRFREGKETTEDEPSSGRPSKSRPPEIIEKVRQMPAQDRRLPLKSVANSLLHRVYRRYTKFRRTQSIDEMRFCSKESVKILNVSPNKSINEMLTDYFA